MRIFCYGAQSSGASLFCYWLSQLQDYLSVLDLYVRERAPSRACLSNEKIILKATVSHLDVNEQIKRFAPDKKILFLRDPCQNYISLSSKPYRDFGLSMEDKFKKLNDIVRNGTSDFDAIVKFEDFVEKREETVQLLNDSGIPASMDNYLFSRSVEEIVNFSKANSAFLEETYKVTWAEGNIHKRSAEGRLRAATRPVNAMVAKKVLRLCPDLKALYSRDVHLADKGKDRLPESPTAGGARASYALIRQIAHESQNRYEILRRLIQEFDLSSLLEIGVYRGELASRLLRDCTGIREYYMVDPWKHLDSWNKPRNLSSEEFQGCYEETLARTDFARDKTTVLRGRTVDVIEEIPDNSLDLAYIDGDHTLRGITTDLLSVYPKVKVGGWIAGDDFCASIWQHPKEFEPTLVFPFAVYFAEARGLRIYAPGRDQFLMEKRRDGKFEFVDFFGLYRDPGLLPQLQRSWGSQLRGFLQGLFR